MPHTAQQEQEIKEQFAARKKRQWIVALLFIPVILLVALSDKGNSQVAGVPAEIIVPLFIVVVLGALIFSLWNWRCPACNSYLGKSMGPSFCPKCGAALR